MSIQNDLQEWLDRRPRWWTYPLQSLLSSNSITDENISSYAELALLEARGELIAPLNIDFRKISSDDDAAKVSIEAISDFKNVNALSPNRVLTFNSEGITVIYGENGSGKSGYVRALKVASGMQDAEAIKGNIYLSGSHGKPLCTIKTSESDEAFVCDLTNRSLASINNLTVFDNSVAMQYIGKYREAAYEPQIFRILKELADTVDRVSDKLSAKEKMIVFSAPIPSEDIKEAPFFKELRDMDYKTAEKEMGFSWTEADENAFTKCREHLDIINPKDEIINNNKRIRSLKLLKDYIGNLQSYFDHNLANATEIILSLSAAEVQYEVLSISYKENADQIDIDNIDNQMWRNLWKYANEYINSLQEEYRARDVCPLCLQKMSDHTLLRFNTINDYVNDRLSIEITSLKQELMNALYPTFTLWERKTIEQVVENSFIESEKDLITDLITTAGDFIAKLPGTLQDDHRGLSVLLEMQRLSALSEFVLSAIGELETYNKTLLSMEDPKEIDKYEKILMDLKVRKFCYDHSADYARLFNSYELKNHINEALKLAKTNAITNMTNKFASLLLSDDYEKRFNQEMTYLTNGSVKAVLRKAKGGKGRVPLRIQLQNKDGKDYLPSEILSEGEQRIVSLAAFISDNSIGNTNGPLVFDDPISSLDHTYEGRTVNRLVEIAKRRQVIIFTHRLSLLYALESACKKASISFTERCLVANDTEKGVPRMRPASQKVKKRLNNLLSSAIPNLRDMDIASDLYNSQMRGICSEFREIVEQSIEEILLCNITSRFQREIRSTRIKKLKEVTAEDCDVIDKFMSKYSESQHSQSTETPMILPGVDELRQDVSDFLDWAIEAKLRLVG